MGKNMGRQDLNVEQLLPLELLQIHDGNRIKKLGIKDKFEFMKLNKIVRGGLKI
jgi:hypothetical protein